MKLISSNEIIEKLVEAYPEIEKDLSFCTRLQIDLKVGDPANITYTKVYPENFEALDSEAINKKEAEMG